MDDEDAFLYGESSAAAPPPPVSTAIGGDDVLDFELDGENNFGVGGGVLYFPNPSVNPFVFLLITVCFVRNSI